MRHTVVYDAAPVPNRINEDAYVVYEDDDFILMLVADGATPRLRLSAVEPVYRTYGDGINGASYASRLLREIALERRFDSPKDILLHANARLRQSLESVYGALDLDSLLRQEPQLPTYLRDDPRLIRLALPVAVATVARVDLKSARLEFAHAGDCALFLIDAGDAITCLTHDQMQKHDARALRSALELQSQHGLAHVSDAISVEQVIQANRLNGLYHNYVDKNGRPDSDVGVGVINGLPELADYMQTGVVDLANASALLLMSDGAILPGPLEETADQQNKRFRSMWNLIQHNGLSGYLDAVRALEAADSTFDVYPRFKLHDDATAIYLEL